MSPLTQISQSNIKVTLAPINKTSGDFLSPIASLNRPKNPSRRGFREGGAGPQTTNNGGEVIFPQETTDPVSALLRQQKSDPLAFMKLGKMARRESSSNTPSIFESPGKRDHQKPIKLSRFETGLQQLSEEVATKEHPLLEKVKRNKEASKQYSRKERTLSFAEISNNDKSLLAERSFLDSQINERQQVNRVTDSIGSFDIGNREQPQGRKLPKIKASK